MSNKVSQILRFKKTIEPNSNGVGVADTTVRLDQSLKFNNNQTKKTFKVIDGYISSAIPNVYKYGTWDNTVIHVSNDAFVADDQTITLEAGIYSANDIANAINASVSSLYSYIDTTDPPLQIYTNEVVSKCYLVIDSTKMSSGQFAIDLGQSDIATTLGFSATTLFDTNGTHEGDVLAQFDTIGNLLNVKIEGIGNTSITNSSSTNDIAVVDLTQTTSNVYRISTSFSNNEFTIEPPREIASYKLTFTGSRSDRQVVWKEGEVDIIAMISEYI
jgi:hypothetical protein